MKSEGGDSDLEGGGVGWESDSERKGKRRVQHIPLGLVLESAVSVTKDMSRSTRVGTGDNGRSVTTDQSLQTKLVNHTSFKHIQEIWKTTERAVLMLGKSEKRSYVKPPPRAVIFLQNRFHAQQRCSYHLPAAFGQ